MIRIAGAIVLAVLPTRGDYHEGATLDCSECHVMHRSGPPAPSEGLRPAGSERSWVGELLKEDVNDLCLACHDGSSQAADVLGPNRGSRPGDVRQGGFLARLGITGLPGTGHTLDSLEVAAGSSPAWSAELENGSGNGLSCVNCHSAHGTEQGPSAYRNLRDDAGDNPPGHGLVTYNETAGLNDLARDVYLRQSLDYDESALDFNEPDPSDSGMGRFCAGCHTDFHGLVGSPQIGGKQRGASYVQFERHPTAGVNLGATPNGAWSSLARFASRGNRVKVMSESGVWDPPGSDVTPTCISCHKAHGNDNAFGLIYRSGTGRLTENGDAGGSTLEHLCGQCHGEPTAP